MDIQKLSHIAYKNPNGFTIDLLGNYVLDGYIVAYEDTQNSFGAVGCKKVLEYAKINNTLIGGWYNSENNKYYFDACKRFEDVEQATKFAIQNNQLAFFDMYKMKEIRL